MVHCYGNVIQIYLCVCVSVCVSVSVCVCVCMCVRVCVLPLHRVQKEVCLTFGVNTVIANDRMPRFIVIFNDCIPVNTTESNCSSF